LWFVRFMFHFLHFYTHLVWPHRSENPGLGGSVHVWVLWDADFRCFRVTLSCLATSFLVEKPKNVKKNVKTYKPIVLKTSPVDDARRISQAAATFKSCLLVGSSELVCATCLQRQILHNDRVDRRYWNPYLACNLPLCTIGVWSSFFLTQLVQSHYQCELCANNHCQGVAEISCFVNFSK